MYRIQGESSHEIEINKSRFICYLNRVSTELEAKEYIKQIKKLHPKATHHCQAILINQEIQRSNDDGEPSGTAGLPMLQVLRKQEMELICAVVVRYFGGILLGAGGLIRAYSKSVSEALKHTTIYTITPTKKYQLVFSYEYSHRIEHLLKNDSILSKDYQEKITYLFLSNQNNLLETIQEITSGTAILTYLETIEIEFPEKKEIHEG